MDDTNLPGGRSGTEGDPMASQVEERLPLASLLAALDAQQLRSILLALAEGEPHLIDPIERQALAVQRPPAGVPLAGQSEVLPPAHDRRAQLPSPDSAGIRRQLRAALREVDRRDDYDEYGEGDDALAEAYEMLDEVRPYLEAMDGRAALVLLTAMTEEYLARWPAPYGDYSLGGEFFQALGELWTEAILSADLTPAERRDWDTRLAAWQEGAAEYDGRSALDAARDAARQGWDDCALVRILQGEITEKRVGEAPRHADALAVARLNVLERQGRHQEYLYLAEAEGQTERYLAKLVQVGRIQNAVEEGLKSLTTADQCLALAQALRQSGAIEEALRSPSTAWSSRRRPPRTRLSVDAPRWPAGCGTKRAPWARRSGR